MLHIFDSTCILLAKAEHKHFLYTKKKLAEAGLDVSPGQLSILYSLYMEDNISISELSKKVFLDNSTLTGLIDRMERAELVLRVDAPNDRRSYQVVLTEKAKSLQKEIYKVQNSIEKEMLENYNDAEIQAFRNILTHIFNDFEV